MKQKASCGLRIMKYFLVAMFFLLKLVKLEGCLEAGTVSIFFDSSPTATTPMLLQQLKKLDIKAFFAIDPEKLSLVGTSTIIKQMLNDGHDVGISLTRIVNIDSMSVEGLRGTMQMILTKFENISGKKPMIVKAPAQISKEKVQQLENMDFMVIFPDLEIGTLDNSCSQLEQYMSQKTLASSLTVSISETEEGCNSKKLSKVLEDILKRGFKFVSISTCYGIETPYQRKGQLGLVNFTLVENSSQYISPATSQLAHAQTMRSSANRLKVFGWLVGCWIVFIWIQM